jgi:hypothetical protein
MNREIIEFCDINNNILFSFSTTAVCVARPSISSSRTNLMINQHFDDFIKKISKSKIKKTHSIRFYNLILDNILNLNLSKFKIKTIEFYDVVISRDFFISNINICNIDPKYIKNLSIKNENNYTFINFKEFWNWVNTFKSLNKLIIKCKTRPNIKTKLFGTIYDIFNRIEFLSLNESFIEFIWDNSDYVSIIKLSTDKKSESPRLKANNLLNLILQKNETSYSNLNMIPLKIRSSKDKKVILSNLNIFFSSKYFTDIPKSNLNCTSLNLTFDFDKKIYERIILSKVVYKLLIEKYDTVQPLNNVENLHIGCKINKKVCDWICESLSSPDLKEITSSCILKDKYKMRLNNTIAQLQLEDSINIPKDWILDKKPFKKIFTQLSVDFTESTNSNTLSEENEGNDVLDINNEKKPLILYGLNYVTYINKETENSSDEKQGFFSSDFDPDFDLNDQDPNLNSSESDNISNIEEEDIETKEYYEEDYNTRTE